MADVKFSVLVLRSSAMVGGQATVSIVGLRQGTVSIPWREVAHFKIIEKTSENTPVKGAAGLVAGAAAGSLLGPVGAVAGLIIGATTLGSRRLKVARLLCGPFGEIEFRCSAKEMNLIEGWWRAHKHSA
ncbi:MAG: hypothetical protein LCH39_02395 [Proteobacteria bacterium]|nr:hypothetical protein [Pseudomonadota bacterium]